MNVCPVVLNNCFAIALRIKTIKLDNWRKRDRMGDRKEEENTKQYLGY